MNRPAPTRAALPPALLRALEAALDVKALAPAVLQVTEIAGYTDWVLILSGRSDRHVRGITEAIVDALRSQGRRPLGTDGLDEHLWDLLDFDDFIVHVFYHPVRVYYDLESMWSDAPRVELGLPEEVMDVSGLGHLPPPDVMPGYRGAEFGAFDDELGPDDEDEGPMDYGDEDDFVDDEDFADDEGFADDEDYGDEDFVDEDLGDDEEAADEGADEPPAPGRPRRKTS
ncbi:MAG: ribosome silencing factor [Myxococcales bacterium]|nr:ribosome silencing factor [Myxococcales bacterium]